MSGLRHTKEQKELVSHVILTRRSVSALTEPGPTPDELTILLRAAVSVPDHGQLRPYRFVVVRGNGRERFGAALAGAAAESRPDLSPGVLAKVKNKAFVAPTLIALIASPRPGANIPEWEQVAAASCTGYAILLTAHTLGLGAIWKTSPYHDGADLRSLLAMGPNERLLGWVNVGQPVRPLDSEERPDIDLKAVAAVLDESAILPFEV
ncbi:nitroreductase [Pendulispora brunnea]|uniref:Putative NAD(P)H nitroreductase n=1 Tax=Pendulispora brunnea TaxID=2905690 RepID=A0ABZ2K6S6_9BACT